MTANMLTTLEKAILDWIAVHNSNPVLRDQIASVLVTKREYTGVGWFVTLEVPHPKGLLDPTLETPIPGPYLLSPQIEHDGGSLLFHENGVLSLLEIYANGNRFDENLVQFDLFGDET